jgi:hypothetical protein
MAAGCNFSIASSRHQTRSEASGTRRSADFASGMSSCSRRTTRVGVFSQVQGSIGGLSLGIADQWDGSELSELAGPPLHSLETHTRAFA